MNRISVWYLPLFIKLNKSKFGQSGITIFLLLLKQCRHIIVNRCFDFPFPSCTKTEVETVMQKFQTHQLTQLTANRQSIHKFIQQHVESPVVDHIQISPENIKFIRQFHKTHENDTKHAAHQLFSYFWISSYKITLPTQKAEIPQLQLAKKKPDITNTLISQGLKLLQSQTHQDACELLTKLICLQTAFLQRNNNTVSVKFNVNISLLQNYNIIWKKKFQNKFEVTCERCTQYTIVPFTVQMSISPLTYHVTLICRSCAYQDSNWHKKRIFQHRKRARQWLQAFKNKYKASCGKCQKTYITYFSKWHVSDNLKFSCQNCPHYTHSQALTPQQADKLYRYFLPSGNIRVRPTFID
jgi:hypothetical protein